MHRRASPTGLVLRRCSLRPLSKRRPRQNRKRPPDLLEQPLGGSLYELFAVRYRLVPVSSTETIEVVSASPREAHSLGIPNRRPLLAITRITRDGADRPFEYAYDLFRADRVRLTATTSSVAARERLGTDGRVERSVSSG